MPKCLNDEKKYYTGKELSPKGYGYSASGESINKEMQGKDGNLWIVIETVRCKKWNKIKTDKQNIDFDNLPKKFYTNAYIPNTVEIKFDDETGIEEKFGGSKPFFIKGESWPVDSNNIEMIFFGQFKDPRKSNNYLYRIFLSIHYEYSNPTESYIDKIDLNKNIKNQVIIEIPTKNFKPFNITDWIIRKELKSCDYILNKFNITENHHEKYYEKYYDSIFLPAARIKIAGTRIYTDCYDDIEKYPQLLKNIIFSFLSFF